MSEPSCENCRFVHKTTSTIATCHRYAPAVGARTWFTDGKPVWPNVALSDWCGEYLRRLIQTKDEQ